MGSNKLDFFNIVAVEQKDGSTELSPDFVVGRNKDLMVRGQTFYAAWQEDKNFWTTDEFDVVLMIDSALEAHAATLREKGLTVKIKYAHSNNSGVWNKFRKLMKNVADNSHQLDASLTFADTVPKRSDYASIRLPYSLAAGRIDAWNEIVGTLYSPVEREKIEWAIGAIVAGDSKSIEKFLVFYGDPGSGKGTILKIIERLFVGYTTVFDAQSLVGQNSNFATEPFKDNPLVAIQHDGDLSKIADNSKLNSITGHDPLRMNEKFKPTYTTKVNAMCLMGSNEPVKITGGKSGLIRRLIDVNPSGHLIEEGRYLVLVDQVGFELGAIAHHCLGVYRRMGKHAYSRYRPTSMIEKTDIFYNFIYDNYDTFLVQDGTFLTQAWAMYKAYKESANLKYSLQLPDFREELKTYFNSYYDRKVFEGKQTRSVYAGFKTARFESTASAHKPVAPPTLVIDSTVSILDDLLSTYPAQYGKLSDENPEKYWTAEERTKNGKKFIPKPNQVVSTILSDLDTSRLHFVKVPENHIVIDFDLTDGDGNKSLELNLQAASSWPTTYTELSKSGAGVHLHYNYTGPHLDELNPVYSKGIEVKVFRGNSSLRRKVTLCNDSPVVDLDSGLPIKEKKPVSDRKSMGSERTVRDLIARALAKDIGAQSTKVSIDFILKVLNDAYADPDLTYDVTDLRARILAFAVKSTNQSDECIRTIAKMPFKSEGSMKEHIPAIKDPRLTFFDVEVYPNLFVIVYKRLDVDGCHVMINPSPQEVEELFLMRLIGFYNRDYDNHILYARFMGASNAQLYALSKKIIGAKRGDNSGKYGEAYHNSYADIRDYVTNKQSLKKWEIELGIHHMELDLPWDEPVPEELWPLVVEYCTNDVMATEAVFKATRAEFDTRCVIADISGLTPNHTNRNHAERIVFGDVRNPQAEFVYTDLTEMFPGYTFEQFAKNNKSKYHGEVIGEGGYVYAEPGYYENVALLDIASMHPTSIRVLNAFGPYTENYNAIVDARLAISQERYEEAAKLLDGRLAPYLKSKEEAEKLQMSMKLLANSIYGLTCATFPTRFKDPRNVDNIIAKRGALFMVDLKEFIQARGFTVAHIKTDSVKIPNATPEIIAAVQEFGRNYGYTFVHEATYTKMCLVNDAVFIAYVGWNAKGKPPQWKAVGTQFQVPYVFKKLFTEDEPGFDDLCVTKSVMTGHMELDFGADPNNSFGFTGRKFVGRVGRFTPIVEGGGGGELLVVRDGVDSAVTGTKGRFFVESELMLSRINDDIQRGTGAEEGTIDRSYFDEMVDEAIEKIQQYVDIHDFVSLD